MECRGVDETFIKESEVNTFSVQLTIVNFQLSIVNTFSVQLTTNRPIFIIICMYVVVVGVWVQNVIDIYPFEKIGSLE